MTAPAGLTEALVDRYRIERELGQGGMATVYLAQDLKHDRQVALKVLKPELAAVLGAERFVQEIKTTANLQHPHILPLFDSGTAGSFLYYVMPYIEGETLRGKLDRETQLGIDDAVRIAREVADALDYAHQHGVIHRDIKPENILLQNGRAMVADFGIALAVSAAAGGRMTETGLSLGTPHYMSPEQATAEKEISARSDVYSLGSVLYEMLAGEPPHSGGSAQQIIMKIVTEEAPELTRRRKSVPPNVAAAVARSLEKLPADRFESAKAFAAALHDPGYANAHAVPERAPGRREPRGLGVLVGAGVLLATLAAWGWFRPRPAPETPARRYVLDLPVGQEISGWFRRLAIAPDDSRLAYLREGPGGERQLLVLPRDQLQANEIPGTAGAEVPFFSPDGETLGFISPRGTIKRVPAVGGQVTPVASSSIGYAGATWAPDGYIYADGAGPLGVVRVPSTGGTPVPVTTIDTAAGEVDHVWPWALPGGRGILFVIKYRDPGHSEIAVLELASGTRRVLTAGLYAEYAEGYLIFSPRRSGDLAVQAFDERRMELSGEPRVVAQGVRLGAVGAPDFVPDISTSRGGTIVHATGPGFTDTTDVVWVTRDGQAQPIVPGWTDQLTDNGPLMLSPDGRRLAVTLRDQIWVRDLASGRMTQLSFEGGLRPEWTPDGTSVGYVSDRDPTLRQAFIRRADATGPEQPLVTDPRQVHEVAFSPDNQWIVYRDGGGGASDLIAIRRGGDTARVTLVRTPASEAEPVISPDGRWLAYVTLETGRAQVRVRPFPEVQGGNWLVSPGGGTEPAWSDTGRELFYRDGDGYLVSVPVTPGPTFVYGAPQILFSALAYTSSTYRRHYSVAPGGQRFAFLRRLNPRAPDRVVVLENVLRENIARKER